jgi:hypothetical protein
VPSPEKLHLNLLRNRPDGVQTFFSRPCRDFALPASRTRHWDGVARRLATPVRRTGLFSFAAALDGVSVLPRDPARDHGVMRLHMDGPRLAVSP